MEDRIVYADGLAEIPQNEKYSFYDPASRRTLIYTARKSIKGYRTLPKETTLTTREIAWKHACEAEAEKRYFDEHKTDMKDFLQKTLADFERNLKKMAEEQANG